MKVDSLDWSKHAQKFIRAGCATCHYSQFPLLNVASSGPREISNHTQSSGVTMKYKIVLQQSEESFSVSCPALPGCWSQGATEQEAIENIKDAIQEYLAAIAEYFQSANVREIEVPV
jgi:predicted RNase H-like HicB family nuclease